MKPVAYSVFESNSNAAGSLLSGESTSPPAVGDFIRRGSATYRVVTRSWRQLVDGDPLNYLDIYVVPFEFAEVPA